MRLSEICCFFGWVYVISSLTWSRMRPKRNICEFYDSKIMLLPFLLQKCINITPHFILAQNLVQIVFHIMEVENTLDFGQLLAQGAEGRIYRCTFLGRQTIVKERFVKSYRIPFLDSKINVNRISTGMIIIHILY